MNLFTPEGERLMQWGERGTNAGQFSFPRSAVVDSKQEWFVSEFGVVDQFNSGIGGGAHGVAGAGRKARPVVQSR